jgi:hypothetical protein
MFNFLDFQLPFKTISVGREFFKHTLGILNIFVTVLNNRIARLYFYGLVSTTRINFSAIPVGVLLFATPVLRRSDFYFPDPVTRPGGWLFEMNDEVMF